MSKNLTRKGLALGAIVALASTVIAGSPAFAAGEVVVAPSAGTSLNIASGSVFNLKTTLAAGFTPASYAQLKYIVKTDANSAITYDVGIAAVTAPATVQAVSLSSAAVVATGATSTTVNYLGLSATTTTVTSNVEVTAFVDANNDGALTAGEWNTVKTVSFKKAADIVPVVSLTAPATGDTTVKATVVWGDLNIEQMTTETVKFTVGTQATTATAVTLTTGVWAPTAALTALAAAEAVTAQAFDGATALGAVASATASARTIIQPTAAVVAGVNGIVTGNIARTNSAFAVSATVKDVATVAVVKAGVAVAAAVTTTATLSATKTLSINGTVYVTNASLPASVALTTDAAGLATVNFVTVGFVATEAVSAVFSAQNFSATVAVDLQDAAYTVVSTAVGSALRSIAEGGSTTLNYVVKDQFGVAIGSGARLSVVIAGTASATVYSAVSAGAASVTVTDTTANVATAITAIATLETQDVATSNWAAVAGPVVAATQTVNVSAVATTFDTVPVAQAIALSTSVALTTASVTNAGAAVTISSPGVTFTVGSVDYANTVTLFSAAAGDIVVSAKSDIAGAKTITYTAGSETKTAVVTVAAAAQTSGTALTLDAPATILPGRTLLVSGKLVDKFGNAVDITSSAATLAVVYTGPGLLVGSLPTETDAAGTFSFRVLLGANETGSAAVSASYDSNGATADVAGTTVVVTVAKTVTIGAAPVAANSAVITSKNGRVYVTVNSPAGFSAAVKVGFSQKPAFRTTGSKLVSYFVGAGKRVAVVVTVRGGVVASQAITVK